MHFSQMLWALGAIVAVQAVTDAAVLGLGRREAVLSRWLPYLVSGAAGVLLATACLDLLPEAVRAGRAGTGVWRTLLASLLVLFCLQAGAHWFTDRAALGSGSGSGAEAEGDARAHAQAGGTAHRHTVAGERSSTGAAPLLLGSALHSAVDGIAIAAAFSAGRGAGWSAALAVGMHELPHRMGDFALLVHMGMARSRAAQWAIGAGAMAFVGGSAVMALGQDPASVRWLLPVSAATFLYIALVDLVPELHASRQGSRVGWQILCLGAGAGLMAVLVHFAGD